MSTGFWGGIAALGLAGRGYEETDRRIRDRDWQQSERARQKKLNDIALRDALRRDEVATGLRDVMAGVTPRAAAVGQDVTTITPPDESDRWGETQINTEKGVEARGDANLRKKTEAAMDYLADKGDVEGAEKYRKVLKSLEAEGYQHIVTGIAAGKSIPELASAFNPLGRKRIVGGAVDGNTYRLKFEDGAEATYDRDQMREVAEANEFTGFKRGRTHVVKGALVDDRGRELYRAPAEEKPPRNIDPYGPEALKAKKELEAYRASLTRRGADGEPAKIREVKALADLAFGGDMQKAIEFAYGVREKDRASAVMQMASILRTDYELSQNPRALVAKAEEMVDALRSKDATLERQQRSKASGAPGRSTDMGVPDVPRAAGTRNAKPPRTLKVPGGRGEATFTGRFTKDGRPLYSDGSRLYVAE